MEQKESKVFNDCVHGHMTFDPLCLAIIDTPQFQRLRHIKQLGGCYYVFPGASHNRFEHSLGVCHLVGKVFETLKRNQSNLEISECDISCVKIAGLCHDLGHGPFSHMFDGLFKNKSDNVSHDCHEKRSQLMFDHLIENNPEVNNKLQASLGDDYAKLVKDLIHPPHTILDDKKCLDDKKIPKGKMFLYEIVANLENGIDVDKWDYFTRDCHQLGITKNFDHARFLEFVRVIEVNGKTHICYRDKEERNVYNMFYTRNALHQEAYQHVVSKAVELMLMDALLLADKHLKFHSTNGEKTMSTFGHDMEAFSKMTDHIYYQILHGEPRSELTAAAELLRRIEKRDLYRCICETMPVNCTEAMNFSVTDKVKDEIVELSDHTFEANDFDVVKVKFDYGMRNRDPVKNVWFYSKEDFNKAFKIKPGNTESVSLMLPTVFCEIVLRFYWKKSGYKNPCSSAKTAFLAWMNENGWQAKRR